MTAQHRRFPSTSGGSGSSSGNNNNSSNRFYHASSSLYSSCLTGGGTLSASAIMSDISSGSGGESDFVAKFAPNPTTIMSSKSSTTHASTAATSLLSDLHLSGGSDTESSNNSSSYDDENNNNDNYNTHSFFRALSLTHTTVASSSFTKKKSRKQHSRTRSDGDRSLLPQSYSDFEDDERSSIEITLTTMQPYVTHQQQQQQQQQVVAVTAAVASRQLPMAIAREVPMLQPYVAQPQPQDEQQKLKRLYEQQKQQYQQQLQMQQPSPTPSPSPPKRSLQRRDSHRLPRVTAAAQPFEKMIAPTSYLHDELSKDEAYTHAMQCGVVWQSLVGQFVKFPALWYDGEEPSRPYLGCPSKSNKWAFFGRHRIFIHPDDHHNVLRKLVHTDQSSGKLVLHIIVIDSNTNEPKEDLVVGVFHPNAKGIRSVAHSVSKAADYCRDIWLGHRSRIVAVNGRRRASRIESLLHYLNKQSVDKSPLGPHNTQGIPYQVDNTNMKGIFGRTPPASTIFVPEHKLYKLLEETPQSSSQLSSSKRSVSPKRSYGSHSGGDHLRRSPSPKPTSTRATPPSPASVTLLKAFIGSYTSTK